jgi:hypothetical protein
MLVKTYYICTVHTQTQRLENICSRFGAQNTTFFFFTDNTLKRSKGLL